MEKLVVVVRYVVMWCWRRGRCVRCSSIDGGVTEKEERHRVRLRRAVQIASDFLGVLSDRRASR